MKRSINLLSIEANTEKFFSKSAFIDLCKLTFLATIETVFVQEKTVEPPKK